ncbi:hypothetical protein Taro_027721 [Colocasia esculenta]|uniref:Aminotransferase-like plant mobile domain-containing protein n=1 Tax=Colocasia esculenta TaxID=4460 RepID=A0A843VNB7_COLES|nr:hypothetical protein [Colocasia esculenta]
MVLAVFMAFPPLQRERVEEMGFGEIFRISRMRADSALTQTLRSRWDVQATAFVFPWGHMIPSLEDVSRITGLRVYGRPVSGYTYPCYHDLAQRLLELPVERRSSLVPRESLGLFDVGKGAGESEDEHLDRLVRVSRRELASDPGAQADLDLRRFLKRDLPLTTEHAMDLQGQRDQLQGEVMTTQSERDQLHIRAEAAEAQVAEATKELEALRVQRSPVDQEELEQIRYVQNHGLLDELFDSKKSATPLDQV